MNDFLVLIGQIFVISLIQLVLEVFINVKEHPYQAAIINVACFLGSLYFLLDFLFGKILVSLNTMMPTPFF